MAVDFRTAVDFKTAAADSRTVAVYFRTVAVSISEARNYLLINMSETSGTGSFRGSTYWEAVVSVLGQHPPILHGKFEPF